jgi:hypothetical protein
LFWTLVFLADGEADRPRRLVGLSIVVAGVAALVAVLAGAGRS